MASKPRIPSTFNYLSLLIPFALLFFLALPTAVRAQRDEEHDDYKIKLDGFWFYSNPTGTFHGQSDMVPVDFTKDLNFSSYTTFSGKVDWKLSHKNHLYVTITPFYTSKQTTLVRDITFEGVPYSAGAVVNSTLHAFLVAPGYQYDFIRRRRGHIGLGIQVDIFDVVSAKIAATGQVSGGGSSGSGAYSSSASLLAPIPVAGPEGRLYLTDSGRVFVEGNLYGMYLFGYGDFISTQGTLGLSVNKHLSLNAGYQLASKLNVTVSSNRLGIGLTQKGPMVGLEIYF
jgi:hypothetical protein